MGESETRLWNPRLKRTETMRRKSGRSDYRYFNEPDLGPLRISAEFVESVRKTLPELPDAKRRRLREAYGLNEELLDLFTGYPAVAGYFEKAAATYPAGGRTIASLVAGELLRVEDKEQMEKVKTPPEHLAALARLIDTKKVTGPQAKELFAIMRETGNDPAEIATKDPRFRQMGGAEAASLVEAVLNENPDAVGKYLAGKENLLGFFVGQVMKRSQGKADPTEVTEMVKKELTRRKK